MNDSEKKCYLEALRNPEKTREIKLEKRIHLSDDIYAREYEKKNIELSDVRTVFIYVSFFLWLWGPRRLF